MTSATPQGSTPHGYANMPSESVLRHRWLERYILVQIGADKELKKVLSEASEDAYKRIRLLDSNGTFSARVRQAQIRMVVQEVKIVTKEIFGAATDIISRGQKAESVQAVVAFGETDNKYLRAVFDQTHGKTTVDSFVEGQKIQAQVQVANLVSRLNNDVPLSRRVYRSESLANNWVQRSVNASLLRGDSAKDLAEMVRSHIKPSVPGGVSYAAMRLGRTELNNAFHATTISLAQDRPWVEQMKWYLSSTHVKVGTGDMCDHYADIGNFYVDQFPSKPHPQCRCYGAPVLEPFSAFTDRLLAGYYRDWTESHD